jgi:murein DD-endopeptidase MepM/ murein hydrolase activator NlpD
MGLDMGYGGGTPNKKKKKPTPSVVPSPSFVTPSESRNSGYSGSSANKVGNIMSSFDSRTGGTRYSTNTGTDITPVVSAVPRLFDEFSFSAELPELDIDPVRSQAAAMRLREDGIKSLLEDIKSPAAPAAVGPRIAHINERAPGFTAEQIANAKKIVAQGNRMGMSKRDLVIGLMTAMQESGLRNVNYGDRDSLGLFQQRPSMGWGTPEQVTTPRYAATKFFEGLKGVEDRKQMPLTLAAQAVQRSAYPYAYAQHEDEARSLITMGRGKPRPFFRGLNGLIMPVEGATLADITSDFGPRTHPITGRSSNHTGADLSAAMGTPIYAPQNAVVEEINIGDSIYGNQAILKHGRGIETMYGHMSGLTKGLEVGQKLKKGDVLGFVGSTGLSTGPHLHWETWLKGQPINPVEFVQGQHRVKPGGYRLSGPSNYAPGSYTGSSSGSGSGSSPAMGSLPGGQFSGLSGPGSGSIGAYLPQTLMAVEGRDIQGVDIDAIAEAVLGSKKTNDNDMLTELILQLVSMGGTNV